MGVVKNGRYYGDPVKPVKPEPKVGGVLPPPVAEDAVVAPKPEAPADVEQPAEQQDEQPKDDEAPKPHPRRRRTHGGE